MFVWQSRHLLTRHNPSRGYSCLSLPLQHRLRHRRDFSRVYRNGLRYSSRHFVLRFLKASSCNSDRFDKDIRQTEQIKDNCWVHSTFSKQSDHQTCISKEIPTRIGISISQKVSKKAVVRNRIKRQLKSATRCLLPQMENGWLLVIVVRPSAIQCDYWQFLRELEQTLRMTEVIDGYS